MQALVFEDELAPPHAGATRDQHETGRLRRFVAPDQSISEPDHVLLAGFGVVDDQHQAFRIAAAEDEALQCSLGQFSSRAPNVTRYKTSKPSMGPCQFVGDFDQGAGLAESGRGVNEAAERGPSHRLRLHFSCPANEAVADAMNVVERHEPVLREEQ